ncbi:MAG: DNA-processing protein DprA [Blautia sp.]|jgi:DNA processing protein
MDRLTGVYYNMEETRWGQMKIVKKGEEGYPRRLQELAGMPGKLYVLGKLPKEDRPSIAIVGARMCSSYGRIQAFQYARFFSCAGIQVISGLALGVDGEAHRGALAGETATYAVMGCGPDQCYPARNRPLYGKIKEKGGIISEYPPGTPSLPVHFPARNRIISALADVVLVIEAREKSGSLITVDFALEQGKPVYALPGPVDSPLSLGCHQLISEGAGIAFSPEQVLKEWKPDTYKIDPLAKKKKFRLASEMDLVYSCLDLQPKNLEFLVKKLDMPVQEVMGHLTKLQLQGLIQEVGKNYYIRNQ